MSLNEISKYIALILRHKPESISIFYRSVNGVWLTKAVPVKYLEKIEKKLAWHMPTFSTKVVCQVFFMFKYKQ